MLELLIHTITWTYCLIEMLNTFYTMMNGPTYLYIVIVNGIRLMERLIDMSSKLNMWNWVISTTLAIQVEQLKPISPLITLRPGKNNYQGRGGRVLIRGGRGVCYGRVGCGNGQDCDPKGNNNYCPHPLKKLESRYFINNGNKE